jgi:energy-coupling factor transporter ATP-binding protein EcfA2
MLGKHVVPMRQYLTRFGFKGADQQKMARDLSGGERNRCNLAKLLKEGGNVLLLDEPTNDLDVNTLRLLEEALLGFGGCAMVISHDRFFLDRICTHLLVFEGEGKGPLVRGQLPRNTSNGARRNSDRSCSRTAAPDTVQMAECLEIGCELMQWTYDPLQSLNANFNINVLGARPIEYVVDMYGDTGSDLHAGIGTDRFVVQWDLASARVGRILEGQPPALPDGAEDAPVANAEGVEAPPDVPLVRVAIPADINKAKQAHPEAGPEWRQSTRAAFVHYMVERGYSVTAFLPPKDATHRGYYVLKGTPG